MLPAQRLLALPSGFKYKVQQNKPVSKIYAVSIHRPLGVIRRASIVDVLSLLSLPSFDESNLRKNSLVICIGKWHCYTQSSEARLPSRRITNETGADSSSARNETKPLTRPHAVTYFSVIYGAVILCCVPQLTKIISL